MSEHYLGFLLIVPILLFPAIWMLIAKNMIKKSKMQKILNIETGEALNQSKWGSGMINNVNFQNCIRITQFPHGYLLETKKRFGSVKLWLSKAELVKQSVEPKKFMKPKSLKLTCNSHNVTLISHLCDFFE